MLRLIGLCAGNSPVAGEFPAQMASKVFPFDDVIMKYDLIVCWIDRVLVDALHVNRSLFYINLVSLNICCLSLHGNSLGLLTHWGPDKMAAI